ncbi:ABC transporter ATP-binding protein [Clostridium sp. 'White wine YQ']|uniref:ABC transporter ATP-binding protein n=1 Tax=Clostridium sp. 'White wine YQ' TaxID=3027474 RepID=UPI0023668FB3|nr:ABC transporter ATP-binding protein [Clostridium sp. 'White wine YQ']MDD7795417.1 ABC transporter ATP-binding protein [Clostridium sp. 'White wine YQ']
MRNVIQVNNLMKQYKKSNKISVDNISFNVEEGQFFAFLGPNGAGKSTTISILTTIRSKTSGNISVAGYDLEHHANKIRSNIGVIFQNPSLDLELTAEENIRMHVSIYGTYKFRPFYKMMPKAYKQRIEELAEIVGLKENLFKKLKTFSGGMKRKLEIIRGLMHNPKILFLDEPTQGLDAESRNSLWEYINKLRLEKNITIFLTTHYLEEAEGADRICIMNKGKILMIGPPEEIKNKLLLEKYMYIDAHDRDTLKKELSTFGASFTETEHGLKVAYEEQTPQQLLSKLTITLSKLNINKPTLEEAYLKLIKEECEL